MGGFPRTSTMERKELLAKNGPSFIEQGKILNKVGKENCHLVVVAKPANTNFWLLQQNCPKIPKENFACLTRLDHNRSLSQLGLKAGVRVGSVKNTIVWGNHSVTQYPNVDHGTIDGKPIREVINDDEFIDKTSVEMIQKRGLIINITRKGPSVFAMQTLQKTTWEIDALGEKMNGL